MDIGGVDIYFKIKDMAAHEFIMRVVEFTKETWPLSFYEYVYDDQEAFIYKNASTYESLVDLGVVGENKNQMIQVAAEKRDFYAIVVDDPKHPDMEQIIQKVRTLEQAVQL